MLLRYWKAFFFTVTLPSAYYSSAAVRLDNGKSNPLSLYENIVKAETFRKEAKSIKISAANRQLEISMDGPSSLTIRKDSTKGGVNYVLYIPVFKGDLAKGLKFQKNISIKAAGTIDKSPIALKLNTSVTGRTFAGFGGNFRLQNEKTDPQVIDYCLSNLRVAYSRAEMPWRFWHSEKDSNPIELARQVKLHPHVRKSMEMAQRLSKMGIPVILSAWSGPDWAIVGKMKWRPGPDGVWGNPLNQDNMQEIYKSIGDYLVYLKENYGVDVSMFSFNESDLGINIRQTGAEHAELIKGLGAHFASRGLKTKMLLGDNSDATTYEFIYPAMNDPQAVPYIGAVSFHSWRGWETEILQKWAEAANKLNLPLIVGEGSIDAAAWSYPLIFHEQTYAMEEINLYTRLLAICQPLTILQWQLTADYSPLAGGGIFGDNGPLRPTQRFWNLKQLAATPKDLRAMPISSDKPDVSVAALGDNSSSVYAVHLVNNGATRSVTLSGIPDHVKSLKMVVTDKNRKMNEQQKVKVEKGTARFVADEVSYITLISE
jgi:hypothetical protein